VSKIIITIAFIVLGYMLFQHFVNNPKAAKENIELGNAFLAENATKEGIQTTASGLQYLVLEEGTGTEHPTAKSKVKVHYHGTTIDGNVFDSSVERGEPIEFGLGQVIKGWTEGVQLMVVGQKMRFFIPSNLAYGNRSAGSIQPGSVLIFEVELLDFK
jgi:peptidylprolyl isomerase